MKTVIFLSQRRYEMYHFERYYDPNIHRFVAILEPGTYQNFPSACKPYFNKLYQVELQNRATALEDFTLDYDTTCEIVSAEITQAGGAENVVIIAVDESNIILTGLLRDKFHIPGAGYDQLILYKNKLKMKARLKQHGIRIPKFMPLDLKAVRQQPEKSYQEISQSISPKFVIKPISGASSINTVIISNMSEFLDWVNDYHDNYLQFELEEFIDGILYECDSMVKDEEVVFFVASEYTHPNLEFFKGKALGSIPLKQDDPLSLRLAQFSQSALSALGMVNAGIHMEVFVTPEQDIVFLEVGARLPGGFVVFNYEKNYGVNLLDEELKLKLDIPLSKPNLSPKKHSFWAMVARPKGKVVRCSEPKLKSKAQFDWFTKPGDNFEAAAEDFVHFVLVFYVENSDYGQLYDDFKLVRNFSFVDVR